MRTCTAIPWLLVLAGACKPADEPPRRPVGPEMPAPRAPDLGPPPEALAVRATAALPPTIEGAPRSAEPGPERSTRAEAPDATAPGEDASAPMIAEVTANDMPEPMGLADAGPDEIAPPPPDVAIEAPPEPPADEARWVALLADLQRAPSAERQERARSLNKSGLDKHRKSKLDDAIVDYEAALAAWPAHPFSRYNLACALALQGRHEDALFMLRALGHLAPSDTAAADRLRAARVDGDFAALRADPRFRELTGATDILIAWAREDERAIAKRSVEPLRNARWLARAAPRAWNAIDDLPRAPTVLHRADDAVAARVVAEVARALEATLPGIAVAPAGPLPPEAPPIVVWLPPPAPPEPAPAPGVDPGSEVAPPDAAVSPPPTPPETTPPETTPPETAPREPAPAPESLTTIKDFIGHRLVPDGPVAESLELKPTGFFVWSIGPAAPGAGKTTRTGRYQLRGPSLALTFKETLETPTADGPPRIEVHEGRTLTLLLTVPEPGTLTIEARPFHVR
ncbi:MAG: hypothetical protein IT385_22065 [Deltaproteobacteria bacterium]|nr:hypothetical protein [Deltaproteobacteria bacterium]